MNLHPALTVVFDEAKLSETVHEKTYSRTGRAHHPSQRLVANSGDYGFGNALLAEPG